MELDPLFLIVLAVIIYFKFEEYSIVYISILFHELGHIITACILKTKVFKIRLLAVGINANIEENSDKRSRLLILISGPLTNILLIIFLLMVKTNFYIKHEFMLFFISVNICLAIFNLLPIFPLDGGKIFWEILKDHIGLFMTGKYLKRLSYILLILITLLGIIQFLANTFNSSLLALSIYIISTLKNEGMEAALMNAKYVIYRRSKLLKRGIYQARDLVVLNSTRLCDVINCMDFDRFHILHVLDDDLRLIKILTEHEIMDYILKYNSEITFQEFIKNMEK